jgi:hypothetical protein
MSSRTTRSRPRKRRGLKLCLVVTTDGTTAYGNRAAFATLAEWMQWIAESDPAEHFELHLPWHLTNHSKANPDTWLLFDEEMRQVFVRRATGPDSGGPFELTFMHATKKDLDEMRTGMRSKRLPKSWGTHEVIESPRGLRRASESGRKKRSKRP